MTERYTKNWRLILICDECGLFAKQDRSTDRRTSYGCADPEAPEPYDPTHICERCWPKYKAGWEAAFDRNPDAVAFRGDWQKSRAEQEAAADRGLIWLGGDGAGKWTSAFGRAEGAPTTFRAHCWVTPDEHARLVAIKEEA